MSQQQVFSGRYELVRHIARGGMAQVYLAMDILLNRPVALKVLFPELSVDRSFVERFRREAQAAANLTHPNIVSIYDWGQGEHTYFIVMEFVDGNTLSSLIRQGPLDAAHAASIGADVAGALEFAHRHEVIHRDVKPGNVLIDKSGRVKVTDFGIARAVGAKEGLTQTGAVMGTATYFSPEQAQGFAVDSRSDVYSLGVVLYEMVVGRPPFDGDNPVSIAYKHVREEPTLPSQANSAVPKSFEAVVMRAMAKDPADRYQTAEELRADLLRFQRGEPVLAPDASAVAATNILTTVNEAEPEEEDKSRRRFAALLVGLLVILGVLIFFLGRELGLWDSADVKTLTVPPNLVGQQYTAAKSELSKAGFSKVSEVERADVAAQGVVLGSAPPAGTAIKSNAKLVLSVSSGPAQVSVPDETGKTQAAAVADLKSKGLVPVVTGQASSSVPSGSVISTDPSAGTTVLQGNKVTLAVSTGPQSVTIPNVAGEDPVTAASKLTSAGLVPQQEAQYSSTVSSGKVIGTNPGAGTVVSAGKTVSILVSQGPKAVSLPPLTGNTVAQAQATLSSLGLSANVQQTPVTDPTQNGIVQSTSPAAGSPVTPGSTVTLAVGQFTAPSTTTTTTAPTTTTTAPTTTTTTTTAPAVSPPSS